MQTLLEELKEFMDNPTGYFEGELKDKVDELIEKEKHGNWISVKDSLPEDNVWVLAAIEGKGVLTELAVHCTNCLDGNMQRTTGWLTSCSGTPETRITHWQKLPEPPKI